MVDSLNTMKMKNFLFVFIASFPFSGCQSQSADASTLVYKVDGKESAYPRLSKDGNRILYQSNQNGPWELYIMDIKSGGHQKVMADGSNNNFPDWSADNEWIAFVSDRDGNEEVYLMQTDGSELKRVTNDPGRDIHPYFSPDGKYILINSTKNKDDFDVYRYTIATGGFEQLTSSPDDETCARYSPDMKQIVMLKNGMTNDDVVLMDPQSGETKNLSGDPRIRDGWPMFSHDGSWVYYSSMTTGDHRLYRIRTNGTEKRNLVSLQDPVEDARVCVARDGSWLIFNRRVGRTIEIRRLEIS